MGLIERRLVDAQDVESTHGAVLQELDFDASPALIAA